MNIPLMISETFFLTDPELQDEIPLSYLSHKELYEASIRKATIIFKKIRQLQQQGKDGVENYLYVKAIIMVLILIAAYYIILMVASL